MTGVLDKAAKAVSSDFYVNSFRSYDVNKSAGFYVCSGKGALFKMDVSIAQDPFCCTYMTVNGVQFVGTTLQKMFSDKLYTVSGKLIFRRVKDLYDLYLMSAVTGFSTVETYAIYKTFGRDLGRFTEFTTRVEELRYAYDKLKRIINKPSFDTVYQRVLLFIKPFISGVRDSMLWNGNGWIAG